MHVTIMHFATCFPDWNSLDSVRRAHSDLEAAALAFFALLVVCEALAHLSDDKKTERRFDRIGIFFFAIAVLAEIAAYPYGQRNDFLSAQVIGSLDAKSREASTNASSALTKSGEAETEADAAETASGKAVAESASAMIIASGARKEADSFEKDIVSAKTLAADAESHLAEAQQRAANAELELARIKTPRSLNLGQQERVAKALSQFARQPFALMVFSDGESIDLATEINGTLKGAQWERVGTPTGLGGDIAINIGGVMAPTVNVIGIRLWAGDDVSEAAARALQEALSSPDINIPSGVGRSKWIKDRGLKLVVIEIGQKQI